MTRCNRHTPPRGVSEMDAPTLEALRASIAKWEGYATDTPFEDVHPTGNNCPLCDRFNRPSGCGECPVAVHTGSNRCEGSPYYEARRAFGWWDGTHEDRYEIAFRRAARTEADFLKSLLPETEQ